MEMKLRPRVYQILLTIFMLLYAKNVSVEFHGMDEDVFKKALEILVKANKAQTFVGSSAENMGVKFF